MSGLSCGLPPPALCALPLYVFLETEIAVKMRLALVDRGTRRAL